jgi:hypothetical protein
MAVMEAAIMADPIAAGPVPVDRLLTVDRQAAGHQVVADPVAADRLPTAAADLQAEAGLAVEVPTVAAADRRTAAASITNRSLFIG